MRKKLVLSFILAVTLLFIISPVSAQNFGLEATRTKAQYGSTDIYSIISTIISVVLSMAGIAFLAIMLYAGLRWMTARGNEELVTKAKNAIYASLIGFGLVTLSYGISYFVFNNLVK